VKVRIQSIKAWLQEELAQQQEAERVRKAKADARARKRLLKNAESELKLLEELKQKYPNAV
jgi:hypothetical protein